MADSGGRDAALLLDMLLAAQDARAEGLDEVWRAAREEPGPPIYALERLLPGEGGA